MLVPEVIIPVEIYQQHLRQRGVRVGHGQRHHHLLVTKSKIYFCSSPPVRCEFGKKFETRIALLGTAELLKKHY